MAILMGSCKSNLPKNVNVDKFYTDHGDWDDARIPFIKPYEAIELNGYEDWIMNQENDSAIEHIKKANANNGVIFIYGGRTIFQGEYVNEAWHVIIPAKHIEKCFTSKWAYLDYLGSIGINKEPKLHDIDSLARYFGHNDYMDWKEISKW
jgi:hypothetical protein